MYGLFLSKAYYRGLGSGSRAHYTHHILPKEQLYSRRAVAADVREPDVMPLPYQLAENLLSVMSFCFSLKNLLWVFFFPFLLCCLRCALC